MAKYTENYNLTKIDLSDAPPDITTLNTNWDTLDQVIKENKDEAKSYTDDKFSKIPTPDVSGQIAAHNADTSSHADIRKLASDSHTAVNNHVSDKNNPHGVTAKQTGALPLDGSTPMTGKELKLYNGYGSIRSDERCSRLITKDNANNDSSMRYIEVLNPSTSSEEECVQLVTIGDPVYGDLSRCIFGEHNLDHMREQLFEASTTNLTAGSSYLSSGKIYLVYE